MELYASFCECLLVSWFLQYLRGTQFQRQPDPLTGGQKEEPFCPQNLQNTHIWTQSGRTITFSTHTCNTMHH